MKPNKTLNPGSTVSSKPADKETPNQPITEEIGADSEILSQSSTQLADEIHENKTEAILGNTQISSRNCATLVVSLNNTMLSHMDLMKDHMSKQTALYHEQTALYQEQTALYHDLKASQEALRRDLHDSDGLLATSLAPIKYDLRDSNGHLAKMLRESEARTNTERKESEKRIMSEIKASEVRIINAIEASKEDSRNYADTKIAENNVKLLKQAGTAIFAVVTTLVAGAVVYAEWIVHRVTGK